MSISLETRPYIRIVEHEVKLLKLSAPTMGDCLLGLEKAARNCYRSDGVMNDQPLDSARFLERTILKNGHEAMLEHESATFQITTCRGVTHEIVRHRMASYAQESTRYCNYSKDKFNNVITVINPMKAFNWKEDDKEIIIWLDAMENSAKAYFDLLEAGCSPQQARNVLPLSLKSEIIVTMNFRELRHFFKLRTAKDAHPEMILIAKEMRRLLASMEYGGCLF